MNILITGFGPFGDVADNPSSRVGKALAFNWQEADHVEFVELPVSYSYVESNLPTILDQRKWDIVLMLGVAGRSKKIRLERFGRNRIDRSLLGSDGQQYEQSVIKREGVPRHKSLAPIDEIISKMRSEQFAIRKSVDAGQYLCNFSYYLALNHAANLQSSRWTLFVHLPPDHDTHAHGGHKVGVLEYENELSAVRIILQQMIQMKQNLAE